MRDDFCISFGNEFVPVRLQFTFERKVVLDDAVVNNDDVASAVTMGMRILFRGAAVGCPARVADAVGAFKGMLADDFFQIAQLARSAPKFQWAVAAIADGDAGRVIAAVLQSPKPFNDDRNGFLRAYIADNSTHALLAAP